MVMGDLGRVQETGDIKRDEWVSRERELQPFHLNGILGESVASKNVTQTFRAGDRW